MGTAQRITGRRRSATTSCTTDLTLSLRVGQSMHMHDTLVLGERTTAAISGSARAADRRSPQEPGGA